MEKRFAVYLLTNKRYGTLYIGVTSNLVRRVWEHRNGFVEGFSKTYDLKQLVWFEMHDSAECAIRREKQIKKWNRAWKLDLVNASNPYWNDLFTGIAQ